MRAGTRRGGDAIDGCGRDDGVNRVADGRDRRRLALEQREPEVLGRAAAVLERRLAGGVRAPSMMMMARSRLVVVTVRLAVRMTVLGIAVRVIGALEMDARVMAVLVLAVRVIAMGVPALQGLLDVDQGVETRDADQGQRDRCQACPGSGCAPANHAGIIVAAGARRKPVKRRGVPAAGPGSSRHGGFARSSPGGPAYVPESSVGQEHQPSIRRRSRPGPQAAPAGRRGGGAVDARLRADPRPAHRAPRPPGRPRSRRRARQSCRRAGRRTRPLPRPGPDRPRRPRRPWPWAPSRAGDDQHGHELAATVDAGPRPFDSLTLPRPHDRGPGHGTGSLAHRGLAAVDPPPPARLPDLHPVDTTPRPLEPSDAPRSSGPLTVRGRGPPSASA